MSAVVLVEGGQGYLAKHEGIGGLPERVVGAWPWPAVAAARYWCPPATNAVVAPDVLVV